MTTAVPANAPLVAELDANKANTIFIGSESQGYAGEIHREEGLNEKDWALAHIFTAGPELLSALEDTLGCLQGWMEIADDEDQRDYDYEAVEKATAAIAKARGAALASDHSRHHEIDPYRVLRAIQARINGEFDNEDLKAMGPLKSVSEDILAWCASVIEPKTSSETEGDPEEDAFVYLPEVCPSNHWNRGDDICADCGTNLN